MTKIVLEIKDNKKDSTRCDVKINVLNVEKATDSEKNTTSVIYNSVCNALKTLQEQK